MVVSETFSLEGKNPGMNRNSWWLIFLAILLLVMQLVVILMLAGVITTKVGRVSDDPDPPKCQGQEDGSEDHEVSIKKSFYGKTTKGYDVYKYTFANAHRMQMDIITLGGTMVAVKVPDRNGDVRDVTLGYGNPQEFLTTGSQYFGSLVGRVANRIARGRFTLDGETYQLDQNNGAHHLHGGPRGWSKVVWQDVQADDHVVLTHTSPDGDMNYPGEVRVKVTFQLTNDNEIIINYTARAYRKATPINLTSHPYFNLGGESNSTVYDHVVTINADRFLPSDTELIPTGDIQDVTGSMFDLRDPTELGGVIHNVTGGTLPGYDHTFCINGPTGKRFAARVQHPDSGRVMEVYTNQPGLQFYTGNFLHDVRGKNGHIYGQHTGFCMETQNYPDAINQPSFPDSVLRPGGSVYQQQVLYKFYTV